MWRSPSSDVAHEVYWNRALQNDLVFHDEVVGKTFDVVIVGGGVTGLSAARTLRANGLSVALVDAGRMGGNSALSGGILSPHGINEQDLSQTEYDFGREVTRELLRITQATQEELFTFLREQGLETPERPGALVVARNCRDIRTLADEIRAHAAFGIPIEPLGPTAVKRRIALRRCTGAYFLPDVGVLNPSRAFRGCAQYLQRQGCLLREHLSVLDIDSRERLIRTGDGPIRYAHALISPGAVLRRFVQPHKHGELLTAFLTVTNPIDDTTWEHIGWNGHEVVWELGEAFSYFRRLHDGRILYGPGRDDRFGDVTNDPRRYHRVAQHASDQLFDRLGIRVGIDAVWAGTMYITEDQLPDFGIERGVSSVAYGAGVSLLFGWWVGQRLAGGILGTESLEIPFLHNIHRHRRGPHHVLYHMIAPRWLKRSVANAAIRFGFS